MNRKALQLVLIPILLLTISLIGCSQKEEAGEAMFRANQERTGVYPSGGPETFTELAWKFRTRKAVSSSPTVSGGIVYFGSEDGYLYAVDSQTGQEIVVSATSGTFQKFGTTYYLVIHGSTATPNAAPVCLKAIRLLDKSRIENGRKMASDPAINLAAQLLAAELNQVAGAYSNPTVVNSINQAVLLLGKYQFNGSTHTRISAADAATMNSRATILDDYNNNR